MRVNKRQPDYGAISRQSIKRDFIAMKEQPQGEKPRQIEEKPKLNQDVRVIHISEKCYYAKYARYIVGKLFRVIELNEGSTNTGWYEFVYDADRKALNAAASWSDSKKRYMFERPQFK